MTTHINQSPYDKRKYRYLDLENSLGVLLVHDDEATYSAASLTVGVGSFQDPLEFQGIAHFLEHMLFMGTEKYPDENHFMNYISKHGGMSNAYTDSEITNYYFSIQSDYFEHILDVFSHFFIDPLFSESGTDREVNAVNSEHSKNITNDSWRFDSVLTDIADKDTQYSKFGTGNLDTLSKPGLQEALLNFHNTYYSANIMKLVILGPQSLDKLEEYILQSFPQIENKNVIIKRSKKLPIRYQGKINIYNTEDKYCNCLRLIKVLPLEEKNMLTLIWQLPSLRKYYKYNIFGILSHIIGYEGENSIYSNLLKNGLATELLASIYESDCVNTLFHIEIDLTDKGFENRIYVIKLVHEYLDMLRDKGVDKYLYDDVIKLDKNNFIFCSKDTEIDTVSNLSSNLNKYNPEDVLSTSHLMNKYNNFVKLLLNKYLSIMIPETSCVIISSQSYEDSVDITEKYYGTRYSVFEYANICDIENIELTSFDHSIAKPEPNNFIPEDMTLYNDSNEKYPIKIENNNIEFWFKQDNEFNLPKGILEILMHNDKLIDIEYYLALKLFINSILEENNTFLYDPKIAGIDVDIFVSQNNSNIVIQVIGFNERVIDLLNYIIKCLISTVDINYFVSVKEELLKSLQNYVFNPPHQLAIDFMKEDMLTYYKNYKEKINILNSLTFDDVIRLSREVLSNVSLKCVLYGNFNYENVDEIINVLTPINTNSGIKKIDNREYNYIKSKYNNLVEKSVLNTEESDSSCLLCINLGTNNIHINNNWDNDIIFRNIFEIYIGDKFFNQLRTIEQLGYITKHFNCKIGSPKYNVNMYCFLVQSNVKDSSYLEDRIRHFLSEHLELIKNLSNEEFDQNKDTCRKMLLKPMNNIYEQYDEYHSEISTNEYMFDRRIQINKNLDNYTLENMISDINRFIIPENISIIKVNGLR